MKKGVKPLRIFSMRNFLISDPSWLMNHQTGFLLELDGFCDTLRLAFEYKGIQHNEYPDPFH